MRVLVTTPSLAQAGGVANYYRVLALNEHPGVEYFELTGDQRSWLGVLWRLVCVYIRLLLRLPGVDVVVVNPSMLPRAVLRDSVIAFLALLMRRRLVVFWRGWDWNYFHRRLGGGGILQWWFRRTFQRADAVITLGERFEGALRQLSPSARTRFVRESTVADDTYVDFSIEELTQARVASRRLRILFMSRIVKGKGVIPAIRAYQLVKRVRGDAELVIAGDGEELCGARHLVDSERIQGVTFVGHVVGREKHEILRGASILLFPSRYYEGLPNTILEAMLYGLPVIAMPVGGIPEVVEEGINGYLTNDESPELLAKLILGIFDDVRIYGSMVSENQRKARSSFVTGVTRARILNLLAEVAAAD